VRKSILALFCFLIIAVLIVPTVSRSDGGGAAPHQDTVQALRQEIERLKTDYEARIKALEDKIEALSAASAEVPAAEQPAETVEAPVASASTAEAKLMDISFDAVFTAGTSDANEDEIGKIEYGGHDPKKRGFSARNMEIALNGAVDQNFNANANIVYAVNEEGETEVEVEEAALTTTSLPHDLQVKAGMFITEFGRLNPTHPHTWAFVDQPVISGRLLGEDGVRGPGARISWLMPAKWYSEIQFGMQNANGGTAYSFQGTAGDTISSAGGVYPIGNETAPGVFEDRQVHKLSDMMTTMRWSNSVDLSDTSTINVGFSGLFGRNGSGPNANTRIYGMDLYYKYKPLNAERGWPYKAIQVEVMDRHYEAGEYIDSTGATELPKTTLKDWGYYAQYEWGFKPDWDTAVRYDYAHGSDSDPMDPLRDLRKRYSANLTYHPSHFSKIRLQINRDDAQFLSGAKNSIWLQYEALIGAHGAHKY
jgi:hypothetical protein